MNQRASRLPEQPSTNGASLPAEFGTHAAQAVEGLAAGIAQAHTGICEFEAAPVLDEQATPRCSSAP
jgi:hypothetical protein